MKHNIIFLGIGAQKSGTTWLFRRMDELSEFTLPYIKEFHYFDRSNTYPTPNHLSNKYLINRIKDKSFIKKSLFNIYKTGIVTNDVKRIKWMIKWYFSNYNDKWYLSMFNTFKGITGEISPSYAILNDNDIKKAYDILPNIKIIYLIRNPIDRAWSNYRYFLKLKGIHHLETGMLNNDEIIEFMNSDNQHLRSNYIDTIDRFQKYYNKNQILIGFYDAIKEQPENLLQGIVKFLGGNTSKIQEECNLSKIDNISPKMKIPENIRNFLIDKYSPMMKELANRYGSYCQTWYSEASKNKHSLTTRNVHIQVPSDQNINLYTDEIKNDELDDSINENSSYIILS